MRRRGARPQSREIPDKHRINEFINVPEVRVIGAEGEQLGVLSIREALAAAEEAGLDLVEVAGNAEPPVCRILDYGKLKYREQKKAAEARKRSSTTQVKELRIRYSTDKHDLETKVRKAREFLIDGDRVRFQMRFRGREVVYRELGEETFKKISEMLSDVSAVEEYSPLMNQRMAITLVPKSGVKTGVKGESATAE
ncbi:MAG: translation initiation factor IF-3 [Bdellovibrionales bacterium]|nr:translation initiation factor IF-3 [Bdellovibrionales bacterium]